MTCCQSFNLFHGNICLYIETSQLISNASELTGFYMRETMP